MVGKKRILLTATAIILLCVTILAGVTVALFTDNVSVRNHLIAGDLEVGLWRTNLWYTSLNNDGKLAKTEIGDDLNLETIPVGEETVFGVDSEDVRIVPGSQIKADLEIRNEGNVAFTYKAKIIFIYINPDPNAADKYVDPDPNVTDKNEALAQQLLVTVRDSEGKVTTSKALDKYTVENGEYVVLEGALTTSTDKVDNFSVEIEFLDRTYNDMAQTGEATFDLIVEAVQDTH